MKRLFAIALTLLLALGLLPLGMFSVAGAFDAAHVIYALPDEIVVEGATAHLMDPGPQAQYDIPAELSVVTIIPLVDDAAFRYLGETYSFGEIEDDTIGIFTLAPSGVNPTPPSLTITQKQNNNGTGGSQPAKKIFSTRYDATPINWILFFLCFGWIWMWF
jgi:hypothetical protein